MATVKRLDRTLLIAIGIGLFAFHSLAQIPITRTPPATASLSEQCENTQKRVPVLRGEFESSLSAQAKSGAEQYAARPGPGVSPEKAWGDYAAASLLIGENAVAAWAGLKAVEIRWSGETVTDAGVYLFHAGKKQDALQFLNCAYDMGFRSAYLLEALAIVHSAGGNNAQARQYINQAFSAAPDDVIIETEASFINTGQPPPSRPPRADPDGLDEAIRELEEHAQRLLNLAKMQTDEIDRLIPGRGADVNAHRHYEIFAEFVGKLLPYVREQARSARAAAPAMRQILITTALGQCISTYIQITDSYLSIPGNLGINGSPLPFWADVLRLDPSSLAREQGEYQKDPMIWSMHGANYIPLAQGAYSEYIRAFDTGYKEHNRIWYACSNQECKTREDARWCGEWMQLYKNLENATRQRHNTAARGFDRIATQRLISAENEYLDARDYTIRQLRKMKFPPMPRGAAGPSMEQLTLQGINANIKMLYDRHLSDPEAPFGTVQYISERARWFSEERAGLDRFLASEGEKLQQFCTPALRDLLELLAEEEWKAYLDHLKDRVLWDLQPKTESEFPCEGSIGPLTVETDLNKPGEGKLDLKWKGKSWQGGGAVTFGGGGITGGGVGVGQRGPSGVTVATYGTTGGGFGRSVSYGPFQGKGKISFTSKVSPWNNREYLGIKLKGSAGLGLSGGPKSPLSMKCYPASGSVTIYPRALYEDAVRYLSTPTTRPRS
jgi:hypothetical protein